MVYINPRHFFPHYHVVQLERNFYSLPPLISLSVLKVQVLWVASNYTVQLTDKWPGLTFCQFRMMSFPVWKKQNLSILILEVFTNLQTIVRKLAEIGFFYELWSFPSRVYW